LRLPRSWPRRYLKSGYLEWAWPGSERAAEIAAEFDRLKVDFILTQNTPIVLAAKQVTSVIPIVFATAGDPVGIDEIEPAPSARLIRGRSHCR